MKNNTIFSIIIMCLLNVFVIASETSDLTTEQLVLMLKASSEQYKTISADIDCKFYKTMEPNDKSLETSEQILSKWTREKAYYKSIEKRFWKGPVAEEFINSYAIAPIYSKRLEIRAIAGPDYVPRGIITQTRQIEQTMPFYGLFQAMWGFGRYPLDILIIENSKVTYDKVRGVYILNADYGLSPPRTFIKFYIDPQKEFIPVWQDCLLNDGNSFMQYSLSDFRKTTDGLWIPYEYSFFIPNMKYSGRYFVKEAVVNQSIPGAQLDFEFPEGTIVNDERLATRYRIMKNQVASNITDANKTLDINISSNLGTPATDDHLRTAAIKARELLAAAGVEQTAKKIEVFPLHVYVKPEKSQYVISVKSMDANKPELLSQIFESDKIKLVSLQNQISDKGELVANVQRQSGDNGFQKGTLTLQFKDQKVVVIFVSSPIR